MLHLLKHGWIDEPRSGTGGILAMEDSMRRDWMCWASPRCRRRQEEKQDQEKKEHLRQRWMISGKPHRHHSRRLLHKHSGTTTTITGKMTPPELFTKGAGLRKTENKSGLGGRTDRAG
eukprot:g272.t1